ncbi:metallophosphoesterase [Gryllotalpicola ginsengisoli]|uniref:metallophosphoesterase n=1 Tax=Gryllotalpicola ginsengisoli TaxID=444608 RepID=UPI0003B48EAA|nr:metallophosphoesterase [Gryllotalpicola ginsengisoli]
MRSRHGLTQNLTQKQLAEHEDELGFTPQRAVRWLSPTQLINSGVQVAIAQQFADFADRRDVQVAYPQGAICVDGADTDEELWLDFVADLGDGFDATYTIAALLAAPQHEVRDSAGEGHRLPRGSVLMMGGDEVYPTGSTDAYHDRTLGPYAAASADLPRRSGTLLALPGNHDWYDGLASFLRLFARGSDVGAWRTVQRRSYFAVRLRPGWWLVAVDAQLGTTLDEPQLDYFRDTLWPELKQGDAIILCTASPYWETTPYDADAFDTTAWFEKNILRNKRTDRHDPNSPMEPTGAKVRLWLSGDHHHYDRYEQRRPEDPPGPLAPDSRRTQLITCGLGGAYTMGVDRLAPRLKLPDPNSRPRPAPEEVVDFDAGPERFPGPRLAKRMNGLLAAPLTKHWLPRRNPLFATSMGLAVLALVGGLWLADFVVRSFHVHWAGGAAATRLGDALLAVGVVLVAGPLTFFFAGEYSRMRRGRRSRRLRGERVKRERGIGLLSLLVGYLSTLVIVGGLFLLTAVDAWGLWGVAWIAIVAVVGGVLGSQAFALVVLFAPPSAMGDFKATGLAYEDGKGFLRLHLDPKNDRLTVYPLVVDETVHRWSMHPLPGSKVVPAPASGAWPEPRLIEDPIVLSREGFGGPGLA